MFRTTITPTAAQRVTEVETEHRPDITVKDHALTVSAFDADGLEFEVAIFAPGCWVSLVVDEFDNAPEPDKG